jgi:hypothetical protein
MTNGVATLTYTFSTVNTYKLTATYSGDSYFKTSTTAASTSISTSAPTFLATAMSPQQSTVAAGQTALYSFSVVQSVYTGSIAMSCSGLPANASCSFSPASLVGSGCSTTSTVALSILTQKGSSSTLAGLGGGRLLGSVVAMVLALFVGLRRRAMRGRLSGLLALLLLLAGMTGLSGCGNTGTLVAPTPSGTYTVVVTATGSTGITSSFNVPLTVQ